MSQQCCQNIVGYGGSTALLYITTNESVHNPIISSDMCSVCRTGNTKNNLEHPNIYT